MKGKRAVLVDLIAEKRHGRGDLEGPNNLSEGFMPQLPFGMSFLWSEMSQQNKRRLTRSRLIADGRTVARGILHRISHVPSLLKIFRSFASRVSVRAEINRPLCSACAFVVLSRVT
jgi:hypothetical protein